MPGRRPRLKGPTSTRERESGGTCSSVWHAEIRGRLRVSAAAFLLTIARLNVTSHLKFVVAPEP
jgi:hypothetical protein